MTAAPFFVSLMRRRLVALESLVATKGASSLEELNRYQRAWSHAAERTPHEQPIDLQRGDFEPS